MNNYVGFVWRGIVSMVVFMQLLWELLWSLLVYRPLLLHKVIFYDSGFVYYSRASRYRLRNQINTLSLCLRSSNLYAFLFGSAGWYHIVMENQFPWSAYKCSREGQTGAVLSIIFQAKYRLCSSSMDKTIKVCYYYYCVVL